MKTSKILLVALVLLPSLAIGKNYVFNKTGRILSINFDTSHGIWVANEIVYPYTNVLPQAIDMHNLTSSKMTIISGKLKASLKTPGVGDLHDYEISIQKNDKGKDQLIFKKLDSIMGIATGSNNNTSSKTAPAAPTAPSPQDQIAQLQQKNNDLQADTQKRQDHREKLDNDVKRLRKKGAVGPMNSRKKERDDEDDKIKSNNAQMDANNAQIAQLQAQINADSPVIIQSFHGDGGGTVVIDPTTGVATSLSCANGLCPLVQVVS